MDTMDRFLIGLMVLWFGLVILIGVIFIIRMNDKLLDIRNASITTAHELNDIRTITSELRDSNNCLVWPDDIACQ